MEPGKKLEDPSELNSCDKSESQLEENTDKLRIQADPHEKKVVCLHCGRWVTFEEYEEVDLKDIATGVSK